MAASFGNSVRRGQRLPAYGTGESGLLARQNALMASSGQSGATATGAYENFANNFDASKGLNTWANAAYASANEGLQQNLRSLAGSAVGAGRLDTGLFDEDAGEVVRGTQRDFSQALAGQAMNAQGMQASVMTNYGGYGERATDRSADLMMSRREELGNAARERAARRRQKRRGIGGALGALGGAAIGSFIPGGTMIGARIGQTIGSSF